MLIRSLLLLFAAAAAYAQPGGTTPPGTTRSGPSLPATCSPGPLAVYFKTTATVGLYQCLTANTWTAVPTGSGPTGAAGGKLSGTYPNPGLNAASTDLTDTANLPRLDANNVFTGTQTIGARVPPAARPASTISADCVDTIGPLSMTCYGAKGDERKVSDANTTANSTTLTSATAAFTSADTGRTVTVEAGDRFPLVGTYTSGGSINGSLGQYCTISAFGGGGSGATGAIVLTGTNVIAGSSNILVTAVGTGYTSNVTTATLGNGTATCSGTATVSFSGESAYYYYPLVTTATYVNATTITLGAAATSTRTSAVMRIGTDDSTAILAAATLACTNGGGVLYFPALGVDRSYLMLSHFALPVTGDNPPLTCHITIKGDGGVFDGSWMDTSLQPKPASTLDLRYVGNEKILAAGRGTLEIVGMNLADYGYDSTPFLRATYTTPYVHDGSFFGSGPFANAPGGRLSTQDAVVLGGPGAAWFQGYGGQVDHVFFHKIQRGVYGLGAVNSFMVTHNTWSSSSGGLTALEFDSTGSGTTSDGNLLSGNLFECTGYTYCETFTNSAQNPQGTSAFWDPNPLSAFNVRLVGASAKNSCINCYLDCTPTTRVSDPSSNGFICSQGALVNGSSPLDLRTNSVLLNSLPLNGASDLYRITMSGAAKGTVYYGINTTGAASGDSLYYAAVNNAITGSLYLFNLTAPASTGVRNVLTNSDNSHSTAHAFTENIATGAGGGSAFHQDIISGLMGWRHGVDNADSQAFKICSDTDFVAGHCRVRIDKTTGLMSVPGAVTTPASASASCKAGTFAFDAGFAYFCVATDTWLKVAIATW